MVLAVYDGICQEPLMHLPEHAEKDLLMDIDPTSSNKQIAVAQTQTMTPEEILATMNLPTDQADYEALRHILLDNLSAFSSYESDIDNFNQWKADLKVHEKLHQHFQNPASVKQTKKLVA